MVFGAPLAAVGQGPPPPTGETEVVRAQLPSQIMADKAPFQLVYDHATGGLELRDERGTVKEVWDFRAVSAPVSPLATVPANRPLNIVIENANSLLYEYELEVQPLALKRQRLCGQIANDFSGQGLLASTLGGVALGMVGGQGPGGPPPPPGFQQPGPFPPPPPPGPPPGTRGESATLNAAGVERALDRIRPAVSGYLDLVRALPELAETLDDSLALIAELGDGQPLGPMLERLQQSLEARAAGLSDPARLPLVLREQGHQVEPQLAALTTMSRSIRDGMYRGALEEALVGEVLSLEGEVQRATEAARESYGPLRLELKKIETARSRATRVFTASPSTAYRRLIIRIRSTDGYPGILRAREGEVQAYTAPSITFTCQISAGLAWMDPPPDYKVRGDVLENAAANDARTAPHLLFHIALTRLPLLGALGGIGLGSTSAPDFYVGGSFRYFDPIMLNAGWVWQRVSVLPDEVQVGTQVQDRTVLLDLDRQYRRSIFVGLSFAR